MFILPSISSGRIQQALPQTSQLGLEKKFKYKNKFTRTCIISIYNIWLQIKICCVLADLAKSIHTQAIKNLDGPQIKKSQVKV